MLRWGVEAKLQQTLFYIIRCYIEKTYENRYTHLIGERGRPEVDEGDLAPIVHHKVLKLYIVVRHTLPEKGRRDAQRLVDGVDNGRWEEGERECGRKSALHYLIYWYKQ